jgi:hypothetical protein
MESLQRIRFPLMAASLLAALAAMWAGLVRLGWGLPPLAPTLAMTHGPLMISGFLGTLINLERVVALNRRWAYAAPLATALGVLVLLLGVTGPLGPLLMLLGSLGMVAIFVVIVRQQPALFTAAMAMGALAWLVGNGLWLVGWPIYRIVFWWIGFLVLTIAGERLEMSRVLRISRASQMLFLGITGVFGAGLVLVSLNLDLGWRVTGLGMLALAVWLLRYDVARRTVRQTGLTRFIAVSLLSGFVWLGVSGVLAMAFGQVMAGPRYDAVLHTVFLGFVFSMIFGHAPIILPAVLKVSFEYRSISYTHWALLHLSLIVRVTGDVAGWFAVRQWGGMFNVIALLLFLFNTGRAVRTKTETSKV